MEEDRCVVALRDRLRDGEVTLNSGVFVRMHWTNRIYVIPLTMVVLEAQLEYALQCTIMYIDMFII